MKEGIEPFDWNVLNGSAAPTDRNGSAVQIERTTPSQKRAALTPA